MVTQTSVFTVGHRRLTKDEFAGW